MVISVSDDKFPEPVKPPKDIVGAVPPLELVLKAAFPETFKTPKVLIFPGEILRILK